MFHQAQVVPPAQAPTESGWAILGILAVGLFLIIRAPREGEEREIKRRRRRRK